MAACQHPSSWRLPSRSAAATLDDFGEKDGRGMTMHGHDTSSAGRNFRRPTSLLSISYPHSPYLLLLLLSLTELHPLLFPPLFSYCALRKMNSECRRAQWIGIQRNVPSFFVSPFFPFRKALFPPPLPTATLGFHGSTGACRDWRVTFERFDTKTKWTQDVDYGDFRECLMMMTMVVKSTRKRLTVQTGLLCSGTSSFLCSFGGFDDDSEELNGAVGNVSRQSGDRTRPSHQGGQTKRDKRLRLRLGYSEGPKKERERERGAVEYNGCVSGK